ncbi:hypothetical protein GGR53DRAFT_359078 [Hypoxylon sp. FL1150]|nr:hypothetical protein GGR53DRAFT_359078 [Hypoxylon sp. FL1150]
MVRVARSKRCQRCKRIKIKCDEKWPTCTPCVRAKVECSGPPASTTTFVNSSSQTPSQTTSGNEFVITLSSSARPAGSLEKIRGHDLPGGASFTHFRLHSHEPKKNLTTVADRVAARLIGYLGNDDAPWDILVYTGYTKHLPVRLGQNAALRDCVAVMCSTWANFKRNLPADKVLDSGLYGKALRSVQRAINDHSVQLSPETLAAVTILERLELIFKVGRPHHKAVHTVGIQDLMIRRGPPRPDDHLDVHLALENHAALIFHWLVEGGENFFLTSSQWRRAMRELESSLVHSVSRERMDNYAIGYWYGFWPELVHKFRSISIDPDVTSQQAQAAALRTRVEHIEAKIREIGEPIMKRHILAGFVIEQPDLDTPIGKKLHFENIDSMCFFLSYVMIRIVMNRILYHTKALLGEEDPLLEIENREVCTQTWMAIPFIRKLGVIPAQLYITPLYMSYEGADDGEKEYLLDFLVWVLIYKGRDIRDRPTLDLHMLNMAKAMTGRSLFDTSVRTRSEEELLQDLTLSEQRVAEPETCH